ncbi:MAG: ABC transporter ATP-binding protein [Pseudomonadota bacterium]|nr:ABC transporter ATP-binding protein [Pseudomonadota bacterium]
MRGGLSLQGVSVRFGGLAAVDGVSLEIPAGERRAIIGPNGAGKTTLFNAVTGAVRASSGRILLDDRDVTRMPTHRRAALGICRTFQVTNLFPRLTVAQTMRLALRGTAGRHFALFSGDRLSGSQAAHMARALEGARLQMPLDTPVASLSYGEQRQLELAMALSTTPAVLMLDEPAAGLSPAERSVVTDIVRGLPSSMTVVLIEHDMDLVLNLVERITVLETGRLLLEGDPAAIRASSVVQDVYLGRPHA